MFTWRSKCPNCETTLWAEDLVPFFSYLSTGWKCRYCKKKISLYYPLLELSLWLFFVAIGYFLVDYTLILEWNMTEMILLDFWLFVWFFAFIYTVYDILYLEIPENILMILVVWIFLFLSVHTLYPFLYNIPTLPVSVWGLDFHNILTIFITAVSLVWLYVIMLCELDEKYDILIFLWIIGILLWVKYMLWMNLTDITLLSALIWALVIYGFFFVQILISKWRWMWAWDLRIALVIGLILGSSYWHAGLMLTYVVGSIIGLVVLVYQKKIKKNTDYSWQIPFWPFLTIGLFLTLFFLEEIDIILKNYFLL
jgi:prepilin signal peptidase PulO-like enzyme (type II secretory pathway)